MGTISEYPNKAVPHRKRVHLKVTQETDDKNISPPPKPNPEPNPEPDHPERSQNSRKRITPEPDDSSSSEPHPDLENLPATADDLFDALSPLNESMVLSPQPKPLAMILPDSDQQIIMPSDDPYPEGMLKDLPSSVYNKYTSNGGGGAVSISISYDYPSPDDPIDDCPDLVDADADEDYPSLDYSYRRRQKITPDSSYYPSTPVHHSVFQNDPLPSSPSSKLVGAGVANLGNTCFMNSILQCFTHTVPLLQGLRSCTHNSPCDVVGFCVICAFRDHFDASLAPGRYAVSPSTLADNLSYFQSSFVKYQQEDAHEFMQCALNKLQRCFPTGEDNLVEKIFGGRLISKLKCRSCGHTSCTYEPVIDLSLEIENVYTVQHALESFTKVEKIDEKLTCGSCNQEVTMEKQLVLDQTPLVAAFHLKRFKREGNAVKKIDSRVFFTTDIDLKPYTSDDNNANDDAHLKYDLYAVVQHTGSTPNSGHYFSFVRSAPDKWHRMDDSLVTSVSEDLVLSHQAYILFYARQGTPWFSSIVEGEEQQVDDQKPNIVDHLSKIDFGPFGLGQKHRATEPPPGLVQENRRDSGPPGFEQNRDGSSTEAYDRCVSDIEDEFNSATSAP